MSNGIKRQTGCKQRSRLAVVSEVNINFTSASPRIVMRKDYLAHVCSQGVWGVLVPCPALVGHSPQIRIQHTVEFC